VLSIAQDRGWEKDWNEALAAARKEGTVVVAGPPNPIVRQELPAKFRARFGIALEYIGRRPGETASKVLVERPLGLYTVDAFLCGGNTAILLHQQKVLDPVKPTLLLPDVVDPSKWKKGKPWFLDPEKQFILRLLDYHSAVLYINTRYVKPEEIKSARDLLNPKWKGKISAFDPTVRGGGTETAGTYLQLGEEFVRRLYVDQQATISRNTRQLADWLGRGAYPISLDGSGAEVRQMQREGIPVVQLYSLPDVAGKTTAGTGYVVLMNRAPHPNAARVFLNWIGSKEGLEVYARAYGHSTTRSDINEASFLPPEEIPRAGVNYFDTDDFSWWLVDQEKVRAVMRRLLKVP
jgi:iron(III) transport system substrate-binding protein